MVKYGVENQHVMQYIYTIKGMSCNGCRVSVKNKLGEIPNVLSVSVNLETAEAIIETLKPISAETIQKALPEKFLISKKNKVNTFSKPKTNTNNELKQLYPLFLIFAFLVSSATLLNVKPWSTNGFMLDFMGLFYIVFSFFKLLDLKGFPESFKMYDPLAKAVPIYGWVYPFIEVVLGVMFLIRLEIPLALIFTLIILGITTFGVTKALLDKKSIPCACLGTVLKLPMTKATFIENSIMIVMAIIMLIKTFK